MGAYGIPYLYLKAGHAATDIYEIEIGINITFSSGAQSVFLGCLALTDDTDLRMRFLATQPSRGLIDNYSYDLDSYPNNKLNTRWRMREGDELFYLSAIYADMFDLDGVNRGQGMKSRWNDKLQYAEDDGRGYAVNVGSMDRLFEQVQLLGNHEFYGWFAARGTGQDVFDNFQRSFRRYVNWRFGRSFVYNLSDSWSFGAFVSIRDIQLIRAVSCFFRLRSCCPVNFLFLFGSCLNLDPLHIMGALWALLTMQIIPQLFSIILMRISIYRCQHQLTILISLSQSLRMRFIIY